MLKLIIQKSPSRFDWGDEYAAALIIGQKLFIRPTLDVSVLSVSSSGLIRLKFSQPMINPPLELIRNATVKDNQT
jgi:hypothetical protein